MADKEWTMNDMTETHASRSIGWSRAQTIGLL